MKKIWLVLSLVAVSACGVGEDEMQQESTATSQQGLCSYVRAYQCSVDSRLYTTQELCTAGCAGGTCAPKYILVGTPPCNR